MKKLIAIAAVLWAAPTFAQIQAPTQPPEPAPPAGVQIAGSVTSGMQQFDNTTNSSKLTEYRDLQDNFYLPAVSFMAHNPQTGWSFDLNATNVTRDDQRILVEGGRPSVWDLQANWIEVPHNYSNKAVTPYIRRGPGLFEVPATVPITFKKLATAAADTPGVLATDNLIAAYQGAFLASSPLRTQTNTGHFATTWSGSADAIRLAVGYDRREKSGLKSTFGPIGDRPPRTLNVQLTEPLDYRTQDVTVSAERVAAKYQVQVSYAFSDFANRIDTLQWQNVYATPLPGATSDVWDRSVSVYGVRPLPPDNRYHNVSASFGGDLPLDSRFTATAGYGRLEQNEALLPYSYNSDQLRVQTLPRGTADAAMNTLNFMADYVLSPVPRFNVRTFYRRYDLNNDTPASQWQYVTQDTSSLTGTVAYVNKRVNVPYAWDRQNAGAEATWRLPARTSLTFDYEREAIGREHREADTTEDIVRAILRTRASPRVSAEVRYVQGMRDGGVYNYAVTRESYWYTQSEANDANNPALSFDNHPDMRRFDVSDRLRRQVDLRVNLTGGRAAVSVYTRYLTNDFDSDVTAVQPLLGTGLADQNAATPGDQLGRLKDRRTRYGVDFFMQPVPLDAPEPPRVTLNAFLNYDQGSALQRSNEFNENNKTTPSAIATAVAGPWTRASNEWTADFDDRTWSGGLGATLWLVPRHLSLVADYTISLTDVDIAFAGYGVTSFDGTPFPPDTQYAFSSPPTIREDLHVLNLQFEIPVSTVVLIAGYRYENYSLADWQQDSTAPWVEPVGSETLLRDTSRSFQWGNRLFNLGTYLAPSYDAHIGFVGLRYRF